ncbi:hypothetical protein MARPO_0062s0106 [Marchantia polymorpha]|uniref:Uncharacterized protein n=1 Tax=Marchantia polymorpha TaxID=3197 RepID=A0A2R6WS62_MARPO|nr:hypothetical protein MARPO_0062s0106 [Marchantia polymorpha]|eukprot:PTQ36695.1 hypothetical protein MARPO_0062s0106 [Marchantia polymorpha]
MTLAAAAAAAHRTSGALQPSCLYHAGRNQSARRRWRRTVRVPRAEEEEKEGEKAWEGGDEENELLTDSSSEPSSSREEEEEEEEEEAEEEEQGDADCENPRSEARQTSIDRGCGRRQIDTSDPAAPNVAAPAATDRLTAYFNQARE